MAELHRRWKRSLSGWRLCAKETHLTNRAIIRGPTRAGYYSLYIWGDPQRGGIGDWGFHCKTKDLKTAKAIGRIEAARRLV